jgi:hypothetical protein
VVRVHDGRAAQHTDLLAEFGRGVSNAGDLRQAGFRRPQVVAGELALDHAWWQPFIVRLDPELDLCLGAGIARTTG